MIPQQARIGQGKDPVRCMTVVAVPPAQGGPSASADSAIRRFSLYGYRRGVRQVRHVLSPGHRILPASARGSLACVVPRLRGGRPNPPSRLSLPAFQGATGQAPRRYPQRGKRTPGAMPAADNRAEWSCTRSCANPTTPDRCTSQCGISGSMRVTSDGGLWYNPAGNRESSGPTMRPIRFWRS